MPTPRTPLARLGRLTHRRRGRVVLAWIAALVAVIALAPLVSEDFASDFGTRGSESERAQALLQEHFPGQSGDTVNVVWKGDAGATASATRRQVDDFLARASELPGIAEPTRGDPRVGTDERYATTTLELSERGWEVPASTGERLIELAESHSTDGVRIAVGGGPVGQAEEGGSPESFGLIAAAVVLLLAFGSIVAAGLPIAVALFGLGISASLIGVVAAVIDVPEFTPAVAGLIGIGVGIDYALLVLTRFRSALHRGADVEAAVVESVTTAGRSVIVAGGTVLISLLGLFLMNVPYLRGVAVSASLAVLVVAVAAITLLPALLSFAGRRVDALRLRIPGVGRGLREESSEDGRLARRWSSAVQRRPWFALVLGTVVVAALSAPVLGLRLGFPDDGNAAPGSMLRTAYDMTAEGFGPGANGPLLLTVAQGADAAAIAERVARTDGVAFASPARPSPDGAISVVTIVPDTSPQSEQTTDLVHTLRDDVLPHDGTTNLGGLTASFVDQSSLVASRLPLFVAGVVGLSFLLLLVAFRSPLIAVKAGVMNLFSVGAAYGVLSLFADGGFLGGLLGIETETPIAPFIPVMMFAILFGLSMDYEVFLLSRVREEYERHGDTARAVTEGLARTARVITAAAAIMVVVFAAFVTSSEVFLKLLGVGMATAILVDATIVRLALVPALMQLVGRANWWLPRWLDRVLPRTPVAEH